MRKLIAVAIATVFAAGSLAPVAWAQGAGTPAKPETKPATPAAKTDTTPAAAKTAEKKAKLDINAASDADLKALGFSDDEAKKIVDGRPWKSKDQLVKKNVVSKETYAKVKNEIIAHQVKAQAKTPAAKSETSKTDTTKK